ncbi:DNA-binding domain-containing protein [Sphingomonas sp. SUN039]|uniref:HvfC/BufC N-terminal domain-containing protein n=1 Tax=Sphingomonas sp. SUN039 TaxID=2937787 RepID=UPI00216413FD|nr:DNA-binding domain-containing protein [Sphingomonas sp. SUN039]UVO55315.1 DNA-binding domain-containing protein [Sphingomonas sp. SUN039]
MPDLATFQHGFAETLADDQACIGGLAVYRNTALYGAVEALRANYPVAEAIIGQTMFDAIAAEYAEAAPPRSPVLASYGAGFADWIEHQPWAGDAPYLSDVARFERLHIESLFAADAEPLTSDMAAALAPDGWADVTLRLHPATRFGWATTPAMHVWRAHQNGAPTGLELDWHSEGGLFVRPFGQVAAHVIEPAAHRFLFGIRLGEMVGTAAIATASLYPHADIGGLFAFFVASGVFAAPETQGLL